MRELENKEIFMTSRNHLKFRGYHSALRNVIDGDLVKKFLNLN